MYENSPPRPIFNRTLHSQESDPNPPPFLAPPRNDSAVVGSSLPPEFIERGEVTSREEMTTQYTDAEWAGIIAKKEDQIGDVDETKKYDVPDEKELVGMVDHTLLKLDAKEEQFDELCAEAKEHGFATVCVRPEHVAHCLSLLKNTPIKIASVIGFHEGTHDLSTKIQETRSSLSAGAFELDIVINWPHLKQKLYSTIYNELATLRTLAPAPITLKLILETSQLSREEIVGGCVLASAAGFDFVKTSTGFVGGGAKVEDVRLMRRVCEVEGKGMMVKASGGIRSLEDARRMLQAGATRLGTSAGVAIARMVREGKTEVAKGDY